MPKQISMNIKELELKIKFEDIRKRIPNYRENNSKLCSYIENVFS